MADEAATALMKYYDQNQGFFKNGKVLLWWNGANCITSIADYMLLTGNKAYISQMNNSFVKARNWSSIVCLKQGFKKGSTQRLTEGNIFKLPRFRSHRQRPPRLRLYRLRSHNMKFHRLRLSGSETGGGVGGGGVKVKLYTPL